MLFTVLPGRFCISPIDVHFTCAKQKFMRHLVASVLTQVLISRLGEYAVHQAQTDRQHIKAVSEFPKVNTTLLTFYNYHTFGICHEKFK